MNPSHLWVFHDCNLRLRTKVLVYHTLQATLLIVTRFGQYDNIRYIRSINFLEQSCDWCWCWNEMTISQTWYTVQSKTNDKLNRHEKTNISDNYDMYKEYQIRIWPCIEQILNRMTSPKEWAYEMLSLIHQSKAFIQQLN